MRSVELHISRNDWLQIIVLGSIFGFFMSLFFYYLAPNLHATSTLLFGTLCALFIALLASLFITFNNNVILPTVQKKYWYFISFIFSFLCGALGFLVCYGLFLNTASPIVNALSPFWFQMTLIMGLLTFFIGLALHQFIYMKHKSEQAHKHLLETKIKTLENELNPHFLFNTLNSISELLHVNPIKAETAILAFAKFLRNAIKQSSLIALSQELEMVQTYVEIENIRFNEQIHLHIAVDETLLTKPIPKFSLQLLVENAIKHGYDKKALHVRIFSHENSLCVHNDGKVCEKLLFGTGLTNLRDRLLLLDVGTLHCEPNGQKFTLFLRNPR